MSKEQTPMEELVIRLADLYTDLGNAKRPDQGMKLVSIITKEIEQYTQAKILEALEREHKSLMDRLNSKPIMEWEDKNVVRNQVIGLIEQHYETEVKPNYK